MQLPWSSLNAFLAYCAEHTIRGSRSNPEYCPLAVAIKHQRGVNFAMVGWGHCQLAEGQVIALPLWAIDFVKAFDEGHFSELHIR